MVCREGLAFYAGVLWLSVVAACGDERRSDEPPGDHPAGGGGAGAAGHGPSPGGASGGGTTSPPPTLGNIPPIDGFAPGSLCKPDQTGRWCWYNPSPSGAGYFTIASAGPQDIWIGGTGHALHFDGRAWTAAPPPLDGTTGIWGAARDDVWAVGYMDGPIPGDFPATIAHGDGQTFQITYQNDGSTFDAVWGSGPNDVWAVGSENVVHWDGQAWTPQPGIFDNRPLSGHTIDGSGPDDVWLGDIFGLWHFDGTTWSRVPEFGTSFIVAIAARARNDVWAAVQTVGGTLTIYHFDGSAWTPTYSQPPEAAIFINDIDARAADDVWAVGRQTGSDLPNRQSGFLLHWDGSSWSRAADAPTQLEAVLSLPLTHVAVGDGGRVVQLSRGPTPSFTELSSGTVQPLFGVWAAAPSDVWAVGAAGTALHYDGAAVRVVPTGGDASLSDVWGTSSDDVWAVGDAGTTLRLATPMPAGGPAWLPFPLGTTASLRAVFAAAPDDVWIGGVGGTLLHFDGATAIPVAVAGTSPSASINDIHGIAADDIWLVGTDLGTAFASHFDGTAWSPAQMLEQSGTRIGRVWEVAPDDVWALTPLNQFQQNAIWHYDGTVWSPRDDVTTADLWMFGFSNLTNGLGASSPNGSFSFNRDHTWSVWRMGSLARHTP